MNIQQVLFCSLDNFVSFWLVPLVSDEPPILELCRRQNFEWICTFLASPLLEPSSPLTCCLWLCLLICLPYPFSSNPSAHLSTASPSSKLLFPHSYQQREFLFLTKTNKSKILNAAVCLFSACRPTWPLVHGIQRSWTHPCPWTALARLVRKIDTYAVCRLWRVAPSGWVCKLQPCNDRGLVSQMFRSHTIYWIQSRNDDDGTT